MQRKQSDRVEDSMLTLLLFYFAACFVISDHIKTYGERTIVINSLRLPAKYWGPSTGRAAPRDGLPHLGQIFRKSGAPLPLVKIIRKEPENASAFIGLVVCLNRRYAVLML